MKMIFVFFKLVIKYFLFLCIISIIIGIFTGGIGGVIAFLIGLLGIGGAVSDEMKEEKEIYEKEKLKKRLMKDSGREFGVKEDRAAEYSGFDNALKNTM